MDPDSALTRLRRAVEIAETNRWQDVIGLRVEDARAVLARVVDGSRGEPQDQGPSAPAAPRFGETHELGWPKEPDAPEPSNWHLNAATLQRVDSARDLDTLYRWCATNRAAFENFKSGKRPDLQVIVEAVERVLWRLVTDGAEAPTDIKEHA